MRRHGVSPITDRLASIQRTIAGGAPLQDVFDAITADAWDMLGHDHIIGLRLIDPQDHDYLEVVASCGLEDGLLAKIQRGPVTEGAGGQAIRENRLVVYEHYSTRSDAIPAFAERNLSSAMAAPVRENGEAIGSLAVASFDPSHTYSVEEQISLMTFAEHASLAIAAAKAANRMREAERDRQLFLAMVTHKLKTPLMVVGGAVELLDRASDRLNEDKRTELLSQARRSTAEIGAMIDKLLKGTRAEYRDNQEHVEVSALIDGSIDGFGSVRPISISDIPAKTIAVNAEAFRQALGTLVENAVKHSPDGTPIDVTVSAEGSHLIVTVENEGCLPPEIDPSELFQPMVQGTTHGQGIGLGLYIARRLMASLHGSIAAHSERGKVRFELTVPLSGRGPDDRRSR